MLFGLLDPKFAIQDEATTSVGADLAEMNAVDDEVKEETVEEIKEEPEEEIQEPEEEEVEEAEEKEEETEEKPEEPQVLHPFSRPSIKQITEEFPELFKKFPSLRDMYFREAEYTKVFPTIEDAKESFENAEAYNTIRADVFDGVGVKFLEGIKEADEKALNRFSGTFLATIFKVSPTAFWRAANPLIEDVARNMFKKGTDSNDENLQNAAKHLSNYFFGTTEVAEGKRTSIVKEEVNNEVKQEREAWDGEREKDFYNNVGKEVKAQLISLIDEKHPKTQKSRLDPDGVFSKFIRETIIDRIISDLGDTLKSDKDHMRFMDSLKEKAKRNGRTDSDKSRIISAYLARAKSLIPTLRSKYVSEALGQNVRRAVKNREVVDRNNSRVGSPSGRPSGGSRENYNPKAIDYSKTSDMDLLNDNITYK